MEIKFGEPIKDWQDYGFAQYPVLINNEEIGYKAITRDEELIKILGEGYFLYPNEEAQKVADLACDLAGLQPFQAKAPGIRSRENRLYNKTDTQMRALYTLPKDYEIEREAIKLGVNVYNSIDGSLALGVGLFTYRYICGNGVIHGKKDIFSLKRRHTKGMAEVVEGLKERIVLVMEKAEDVIDHYKTMAEQKITDKLVDRILKSRLSAKVIPEYLKLEEVKTPQISEWELYNDITELIWHRQRAGLKTKTHYFDTLHRIMPITTRF